MSNPCYIYYSPLIINCMSNNPLTDERIVNELVPAIKNGKSLVYYVNTELVNGVPMFVVCVGRAKPIKHTRSSEARNSVLEELGVAPVSSGKDYLLLRNRLPFPAELKNNPEVIAIVGQPFTVKGAVWEVVEQMNTDGIGEPIITEDLNTKVKYQRTTLGADNVEKRLWRQVFISSNPEDKNIELPFFGKMPVVQSASIGQLVQNAIAVKEDVPITDEM